MCFASSHGLDGRAARSPRTLPAAKSVRSNRAACAPRRAAPALSRAAQPDRAHQQCALFARQTQAQPRRAFARVERPAAAASLGPRGAALCVAGATAQKQARKPDAPHARAYARARSLPPAALLEAKPAAPRVAAKLAAPDPKKNAFPPSSAGQTPAAAAAHPWKAPQHVATSERAATSCRSCAAQKAPLPTAQAASRSARAGRSCDAQAAAEASSAPQRAGRSPAPEHLPTFRSRGPLTSTRLVLIALLHVPHPALHCSAVRLYCHWIKRAVHSSTTASRRSRSVSTTAAPVRYATLHLAGSHALVASLAVVVGMAFIQRNF